MIIGVLCVKNNPLNAKLNPICPLLTLFGAHHFFHIIRLRVTAFVFCCISAVNVEKLRECNRYIIYIKIVFCNNCRSKFIRSYNIFDNV